MRRSASVTRGQCSRKRMAPFSPCSTREAIEALSRREILRECTLSGRDGCIGHTYSHAACQPLRDQWRSGREIWCGTPNRTARNPTIALQAASAARVARRVQTRPIMTPRVSLSIIAAILTVGALYVARAFFIPLALALALHALLRPLVRGLERLRIPTPLGAAIIVLGAVAVGLTAAWPLSGPVP